MYRVIFDSSTTSRDSSTNSYPRPLTSSYDIRQLRAIGAIETKIMQWLAVKLNFSYDTFDGSVYFNVEECIELEGAVLEDYLRGVVRKAGVERKGERRFEDEFVGLFVEGIKEIRNYGISI